MGIVFGKVITHDYFDISTAGSQAKKSATFPTVLIGKMQQVVYWQNPKAGFTKLAGETDLDWCSELGSGSELSSSGSGLVLGSDLGLGSLRVSGLDGVNAPYKI